MNKQIVLMLLVLISLLLFGSCDENGDDIGVGGGSGVEGILVSEEKKRRRQTREACPGT